MKPHITANFSFDPNGLGNLVMKTALAEAQDKTRSMRCPIHKQPATISIKAPGQLEIVGCCEQFRTSVSEAMAR